MSAVAVAVEIEHGEGPAILIEIEAGGTRHLVEAAMAVVAQQHVALVAGLRSVAHQQPVRRAPAIVVRRAGLCASSGDCATTWRQKKLSMFTSLVAAARVNIPFTT